MKAAVTFHGTPRLARQAARLQLRRAVVYRALVADPWQSEWHVYANALAHLAVVGGEPYAADLYAAALALRLARWEFRTHNRLRAPAIIAAVSS